MQRTIFSCDVCREEQQQTNHWFAIVIDGRKLTLVPMTGAEQQRAGTQMYHCCGEACASKKVSEFLGAKTE